METTAPSEVRILTVRQPWAWAIIRGGKDVENRVRNIAGAYRGPVAIHAALGWDVQVDSIHAPNVLTDAMDAQRPTIVNDEWPWGVFGAIIGVVDLTDVHSASVIHGCGRMDNHCAEHPYGCRNHCSPWAMGPAPEGWYQHLVLENPRALVEPIPYRGALGLRRLDDDTTARISAQMGVSGLSAPNGRPR